LADYPDWVLQHKKKGTYINRVGGKYYLYAAHSERVAGTKKVRRVSDGYLGRITEADGFIPAKRKLFDTPNVYEYGLSTVILHLCKQIRSGLKREFRANADLVMASGILMFMYGAICPAFYETCSLSLALPGLDWTKPLTDKQRLGAERTQRMIADKMKVHFGDDLQEAIMLLPLIRKVCMAGDEALAFVPLEVTAFCDKYKLTFMGVE